MSPGYHGPRGAPAHPCCRRTQRRWLLGTPCHGKSREINGKGFFPAQRPPGGLCMVSGGLWERLRRLRALLLGTECLHAGNSTAIETAWLLKGSGDAAGLSLLPPVGHQVRDTFSALAPSGTFTHFTFPKLLKEKKCSRLSVSMGTPSAPSANGGSKTVGVRGCGEPAVCLVLQGTWAFIGVLEAIHHCIFLF